MSRLTLYLIIIAMVTSCSPPLSATFVSTDFVPKDLQTGNKILLVKANFGQQRDLNMFTKCMDENYKGQYRLMVPGTSIDKTFADTSIHKYVMVIGGALQEDDFTGVSNKKQFFDSAGTFIRKGSSLYIFDRSTDHALYESGDGRIMWDLYLHKGHMEVDEGFQYEKFKVYLKHLNGE